MKTEFNKKRFWLGSQDSSIGSMPVKNNLQLVKQFQFDEPLLKDHLIYNEQVLMGVAHLSLAINLVRSLSITTAIHLERISFANALILQANELSTVAAKLDETTAKKLINVYYYKDDPARLIQAATMQLNQQELLFNNQLIDLDKLKKQATTIQSGEIFYSHPEQKCYGASLLTVRKVYRLSNEQVLGEIQVTPIMQLGLNDYYIHPCIFDACHVISSYALGLSPAEEHRVPLMVKKVSLSPLIKDHNLTHCFCLAEKVMKNEQIAECNLKLIDAEGRLLGEISGFTTKKVPGKEAIFGINSASSTPANIKKQFLPDSSTANVLNLETAIQHYLKEKIAFALNSESNTVPLKTNFMDLGLDSNNMITMVRSIEEELGIELYPTLFFEHQNIASLAQYFAQENQQQFTRYLGYGAVQSIATKPSLPIETPVINKTNRQTDLNREDIAIIGMSGYLAQSENLEEFWHHLESGNDLIEEIPNSHWDYRPWFNADKTQANTTYSRWGSFIKDIDKFDASFFGISARQADWIDPQLRLLLQSVQETFEDAGVINTINGSKTGVYIGCCFREYWDEIVRNQMAFVDYQAHSAAMSSISGFVSYMYDLQGASIPLDNACASSLTALHLACQAIKNGECEQAVVGGVNVLLSPLHYVYFSRLQALSPTGHCYSFDKKADGYVPGEGVVSILIKPLSQALRDNDNIHAVIKGSAINHVGRANNPYSPRPELQTRLLQDAWQKAGINPSQLSYLEAHGTGTVLGDPIEINALKSAFKTFTNDKEFCAIGSLKAHAGHLEGAAGLASLIKVVLMMKHKKIPAMPHFEELNPYIKLNDSPLYINKTLIDWPTMSGAARLAGISSFGMTGNNAHVVIEEFLSQRTVSAATNNALIILSARNEERLLAYAQKLLAFLTSRHESPNLANLAYTLQTGRQAMAQRAAFVVSDCKQLEQQLHAFINDQHIDNALHGRVQKTEVEAFFSSVEEANASLLDWFQQNELKRIAQLWVQGLPLDWNLFYEGNLPNRISLPTYPFAKERFWMQEAEPEKVMAPILLHPLVHHDKSTESGQEFYSAFSGQEFFLSDHMVYNEPVLPGAAYLEMAFFAASKLNNRQATIIRNSIWSQPIRVTTPQEIGIALFANDDEVRYEVRTLKTNTIHSQGSISFKQLERLPKRAITEIKGRCNTIIAAANIYNYFNSIGLNYGVSFQCLDEISVNSQEALAKFNLPAGAAGIDNDAFTLHPSILDAALQATSGFALQQEESLASTTTYLPFALNSLDIYTGTPATGFVYVKRHVTTNLAVNTVKYDLEILDEQGNVCIVINEFTARILQKNKSSISASSPLMVSENTIKTSVAFKSETNLSGALEEFLVATVCSILKVRAEDIFIDEEMSAYGLDSITLTELINAINQEFNLQLTPTIFFEYPTLAAFCDYLKENHANLLEKKFNNLAEIKKPIASLLIEEQQPEIPPVVTAHNSVDIAIIGMSGSFPMASDLDEFWHNLINNRDCISEIPLDRWDWKAIDGTLATENKTPIKWGGFLNDLAYFDPLFFGLSPAEAEIMDPQQRLLLKHAWLAIEDAGYSPRSLSGSNTGVFIGTASTGYQKLVFADGQSIEGFSATAVVPSIGPNRLSYYLNFHGPSEPVETACSSSLVAIHRAVEALKNKQCDLVIAGGINTLLDEDVHISFSKAGMLCEDGRCKTFSADANGYVRGEGTGIVVLKRLEDALADHDSIYAVIKATAINHGGRAQSLTAPNALAQAALLESVYRQANIDINTVTYIEAHGTGTPLGDPVEINGLKKAFGSMAQHQGVELNQHYCGLGSVKSNIGHLELAAGIAGVIKVLLAMKHGQLPASIHSQLINPYIHLDDSPFYIVQENRVWPRLATAEGINLPRRAGVSSFGFGGVNAHLVVEEFVLPSIATARVSEPALIILSAKTKESLQQYVLKFLQFIQAKQLNINLRDLEFTLQVGREEMEYRLAFLATTLEDVETQLQVYSQDLNVTSYHQIKLKKPLEFHSTATYLQQRDKEKLKELWLDGVLIDWMLLYQTSKPKRISLPTYPFAQERYWLSMTNSRKSILKAEHQSAVIKPPENLLYGTLVWQDGRSHSSANSLNSSSKIKLFIVGLKDEEQMILALDPLLDVARINDDDEIELFLQAFNCIKTSLQTKLQDSEQLWFITPDSYRYASLSGLIKTAQKENPKLQGKVIYRADNVTIQHILACERQATEGATEVRYNANQQRQIRQVVEITPDIIDESSFKPTGVYWITGGLGGLGLIFARYLSQFKQVTLILSGRSALSEEGKKQLADLATQTSVHYLMLDVNQQDAVEKAVNHIQAQHGPLKGIIHSAGITKDAFILKKTEAEILQVMAPKVKGLLHLDAVASAQPLDFFIVFSSLAGALGSIGQADYAGANSFMDAFIAHRNQLTRQGLRQGKSLAINWPLWKDGGMKVDEATEQWMTRTSGLVPLNTDLGWLAFKTALNTDYDQCLVLEGEPVSLRKHILLEHLTSQIMIKENKTDLLSQTVRYLKKNLAQILKLSVAQIDETAALEKYGIDSVMVLSLTNELERTFGSLPKTLFFEYQTLIEMAGYFIANHRNQLALLIGDSFLSVTELATPVISGESIISKPAPIANANANSDIAIIGLSGRYPQAPDLEVFWHN